jgi:hypothetical protein
MSEPESVSERELAQQLEQELFSPSSEAATEEAPEAPETDAPIEVTDTPEQPEEPEVPPAPEQPQEPKEEEAEEEEAEAVGDENVVWAKGRFGEDTDRWAKILRDQDRHISQLANEKREAEQLAADWYEEAQQVGRQAPSMPMSASEEEWVENAMADPYGNARAAVLNGNMQLYHAVIGRVAEENPLLSSQIGTAIQQELQQLAAQEQQQYQPRPLQQTLGESFQRLGLSLDEAGPQMMEKVGELGEYHPYVQAILNGDDGQRDLAIQAVFDLAREGRVTKRRVRDEAREATIRREAELRREAAGVVSGAPHTPPQQEDPLLAAMTEEWKARRQWSED